MHDLRASCVTNLANACVTLLQAKEWAGNAGLEVHDRYNVVKRQSRAVVGERYGQLLSAELQQSGASEGWQNGECTGLENRRPQGHAGSNPAPSAFHPRASAYRSWAAKRVSQLRGSSADPAPPLLPPVVLES